MSATVKCKLVSGEPEEVPPPHVPLYPPPPLPPATPVADDPGGP